MRNLWYQKPITVRCRRCIHWGYVCILCDRMMHWTYWTQRPSHLYRQQTMIVMSATISDTASTPCDAAPQLNSVNCIFHCTFLLPHQTLSQSQTIARSVKINQRFPLRAGVVQNSAHRKIWRTCSSAHAFVVLQNPCMKLQDRGSLELD